MNTSAVVNAYRRIEQVIGQKFHGGPERAERRFTDQEDSGVFTIGYADSHDREALAYLIEAARFLCSVQHDDAIAITRLALEAMEKASA